jgi:uncharacterized protein YbjT (DUF2867 family)
LRRILLCGATGHLGRHVLKQLGSSNCLVRALVRSEAQASELLGFAHEVTRADLTDPASLRGCCAGVDTVVSAAGASVHLNTRGAASFRDVDFTGHRNLLEEARAAGVRKFVYVSVFTSPELSRTEYVRAKEDFAALLAQSGLHHHILRPTGFFSAFADLIGMARKGSLPMFGDGSARSNPIDDEEVAAACVEGIDSPATHRSIGGPDILTRKQITDLVFAAIGREARYRRVPLPVIRMIRGAAGLMNRRLADLIEFYLVVTQHDAVAPAYGTRRIEDYFRQIARYS